MNSMFIITDTNGNKIVVRADTMEKAVEHIHKHWYSLTKGYSVERVYAYAEAK
jgi:hypothetical protein